MATYIDAEGVREAMLDFGDDMDRLGYPGVLESVEGSGVVGRALRNIRTPGAMEKVAAYMKNVAKDLKARREVPSSRSRTTLVSARPWCAWSRRGRGSKNV